MDIKMNPPKEPTYTLEVSIAELREIRGALNHSLAHRNNPENWWLLQELAEHLCSYVRRIT